MENCFIQEEEYNIRKKQLLELLPTTSTVFQMYSEDKTLTSSSPSFLIIDGEKIENTTNKSQSIIKSIKSKREIRIFISSTFKDMQEERGILK